MEWSLVTDWVLYYWQPDRILRFVFWGGLLHVGTYATAFILDRAFFGPWKTEKAGLDLRHDYLCLFLELFNFRKALGNVMMVGAIAFLFRQTDGISLGLNLESQPVVGFFVYILVFDFLLYWYHRLSHKRILWVQHAYHHSATNLNPLSDIRIHALSFPFLFLLVVFPVSFVYKLGPWEVLIYHWVANLLSISAHSRWDTDYGWLGRHILVSPRYHRLHHSNTARKHTNFGTYFVFWDKMFGTYSMPERSEKILTGIPESEIDYLNTGKGSLRVYFEIFPRFFRELFSTRTTNS